MRSGPKRSPSGRRPPARAPSPWPPAAASWPAQMRAKCCIVSNRPDITAGLINVDHVNKLLSSHAIARLPGARRRASRTHPPCAAAAACSVTRQHLRQACARDQPSPVRFTCACILELLDLCGMLLDARCLCLLRLQRTPASPGAMRATCQDASWESS
jgi:hypothetical protein